MGKPRFAISPAVVSILFKTLRPTDAIFPAFAIVGKAHRRSKRKPRRVGSWGAALVRTVKRRSETRNIISEPIPPKEALDSINRRWAVFVLNLLVLRPTSLLLKPTWAPQIVEGRRLLAKTFGVR